jgi:hypothetical protein
VVEHHQPPPLLVRDRLVGSPSHSPFDGSQERHPAIATGLTILDATDNAD